LFKHVLCYVWKINWWWWWYTYWQTVIVQLQS